MHFDLRTLIPYLLAAVLLLFVVRRTAGTRKITVERLWLSPVFLVLAALALLAATGVPGSTGLASLAAAFCVGGAVGWYRGRSTQVAIDPQTHEMTSHPSLVGVMVVTVLFFLRYFVGSLATYQPAALPGGPQGHAGLITDGLVVFAVGLVAAQQFELWLRRRTLLAEAVIAAGAAG